MAKQYTLQFGTGDPRTFTGLNATFLIFKDTVAGSNVTPPGITEVPSATGLYYFTWGTTSPITFLADAATTSPGTSNRYIAGSLDPADRIDEVGTTLVAIGNSLTSLGASSVGLLNMGVTLVGIGNTSIALGISNFALGTSIYALEQTLSSTLGGLAVVVGSTASLIGDSSTAPVDLFGYLKRARDTLEGQERFVKGTGIFTIFDRTGATTLSVRTVTNNSSLVTKI